MRVDILLNGNAGNGKQDEIQARVRRVLFRCDLHFHTSSSVEEMRATIERVCELGSEALIICGGDGTLNSSLAPLIKRYKEHRSVPPICVVPVGTANDLAWCMRIPKKIERAARAVLEGRIRNVDVIEITSGGHVSHMMTNGGLGIPAETAENSNRLRSWVKKNVKENLPLSQKGALFRLGEKLIAKSGPKIYEAILIHDVIRWRKESWDVTLEIPGREPIHTKSPFILINNQARVGGSFMPAPLTSNSDGLFNVFLIEQTKFASQMKAIVDIRREKMPNSTICPTFETASLKLRSGANSRPLTFFGDGDILHRNVRELEVTCLHPGIPLVTLD